jgi:hypothetical protein
MTYVKETCARSNRHMFVNHAAVLDGHLPTGKLDHLSARASMRGIERSPLHWLRHGVSKYRRLLTENNRLKR